MARVFLTKNQQLELCLKREDEPEWSLNDLAKWAMEEFQLAKPPGKATVFRILKTKRALLAMWPDCRRLKRARGAHMLRLDTSVAEAVAFVERGKVALSGGAIIALARVCAAELRIPAEKQPLFTRGGWLRHFLVRHGLKYRRAHGESDAVDRAAAQASVQVLRTIIRNYHPDDVYNMDEAAYFYKAVPRASICMIAAPALKQQKARVTFVVATNASGSDKLPLMVLGTSHRPRWFQQRPADVEYVGTRKGWMTVPVFRVWLLQLNERMRQEGRSILLLLDNAPVHIVPNDLLSHVRVHKLPPQHDRYDPAYGPRHHSGREKRYTKNASRDCRRSSFRWRRYALLGHSAGSNSVAFNGMAERFGADHQELLAPFGSLC